MNNSLNLTYNPNGLTSCYDRLANFTSECNNFQLKIYETFNNRLETAIIILIILIYYQIYIYNAKPKYSELEWYDKYVNSKIELTILILGLCIIYMIYMI